MIYSANLCSTFRLKCITSKKFLPLKAEALAVERKRLPEVMLQQCEKGEAQK